VLYLKTNAHREEEDMPIHYRNYYGFEVGDRVTSGGDSRGTVVDPGYDVDDEIAEYRCVPVHWDSDHVEVISWTMSANLRKIPR